MFRTERSKGNGDLAQLRFSNSPITRRGAEMSCAKSILSGIGVLVVAGFIISLAEHSDHSTTTDVGDNAPATPRTSPVATAQIQFDQNDAVHAEQLNSLEAQTDLCLRDAIKAELQVGVRGRAAILNFSEQACGQALIGFLSSVGRPEKEGKAWVNMMAERELADAVQD